MTCDMTLAVFLSAALMNFVCIIFFVASNETSDNTNEGNPMGLLLGPLYVLVGACYGQAMHLQYCAPWCKGARPLPRHQQQGSDHPTRE